MTEPDAKFVKLSCSSLQANSTLQKPERAEDIMMIEDMTPKTDKLTWMFRAVRIVKTNKIGAVRPPIMDNQAFRALNRRRIKLMIKVKRVKIGS